MRRWKLGERASLHRDGRARVEGARLGGVGVVRVAEVSVAAEPDPSSVVDAAHDGLEVVVRGGRGRMGHTPPWGQVQQSIEGLPRVPNPLTV